MAMASCASPKSIFLTGQPLSRSYNYFKPSFQQITSVSYRCSADKGSNQSESKTKEKLAKLALVAVTAGVLALSPLSPVQDAMAAKSGGRIGGQAFRSAAPPRTSMPRINNSRSNIYINPPVAPPLVGGYGYGYGVPFFGGGFGWSPFAFFAPGPSVALGAGGGIEFFVAMVVLSAIASVFRRFNKRRDDYDDDY